MKKIVSLLLCIIFCVMLPLAAYADGVQSPGPEPPHTGDHSSTDTWLIVMLVALVAIVVTIIVFKKMEKK